MPFPSLPPTLEAFVENLPDETAARRFAARLAEEHPDQAKRLWGRPETLSYVLMLSAHSPWLSETLLQHPSFLGWLDREVHLESSKNRTQLREDLARFAAMNSSLEPAVLLSRFKRREWIRIYLRDCLGHATLSELTEELSNVADAVLEYAVKIGWSALEPRYGTPSVADDRDRRAPANFAVLGLGKLGSRELNFSSDIDLMFVFSGKGETSGGTEGTLANQIFFIKLSEMLLKLVGSTTSPEGAAFRVDVRLRPHGRDGALAIAVPDAVEYYLTKAQNWERLAMLRARGVAGNIVLAHRFLLAIREAVFRPEPLAEALRDVRLAKEKIDRKQTERGSGYNVKLGKGGIREIEFIAQALQVCHGGQDAWLRAPQTLIGLQRLAERGYLTATELTRLSEAYAFLRTCEHRLQMEHGAQTHTIPIDEDKLSLLARRMGYKGPHPARILALAVARHRDFVTATYDRIFAGVSPETAPPSPVIERTPPPNPLQGLYQTILAMLSAPDAGVNQADRKLWEAMLEQVSGGSPDPIRTLHLLRDIIASWTAYVRDQRGTLSYKELDVRKGVPSRIIQQDYKPPAWDSSLQWCSLEVLTAAAISEAAKFCESGEFFARQLTRHPHLLPILGRLPARPEFSRTSFQEKFSAAVEAGMTVSEINAALRSVHVRSLVEIGRADVIAGTPLRVINLAQTALAEATLDIAGDFVRTYLRNEYGDGAEFPTWCLLGLGRLGHQGIDYGSDLDIIVVYDDDRDDARGRQMMIKFVELLSSMLSSLTAEGLLYRVDLRLRPDGRNGPLAVGRRRFLAYLRERAASWEFLAYMKIRPVSGDPRLGRTVQAEVIQTIFDIARPRLDAIGHEVRDVRHRLELERGGRDAARDYKFGPGGMMDVYFITRYVQIRDRIPDPEEYGTVALIHHLMDLNALEKSTGEILRDGYGFLRQLDHTVRLLSERQSSKLPANANTLARTLKYRDSLEFEQEYRRHTTAIRRCYLDMFADAADRLKSSEAQ